MRASVDYSSDPSQYDIGYTSMFAEAVGVAPFKDDFWTTGVQPGNPGSKLKRRRNGALHIYACDTTI